MNGWKLLFPDDNSSTVGDELFEVGCYRIDTGSGDGESNLYQGGNLCTLSDVSKQSGISPSKHIDVTNTLPSSIQSTTTKKVAARMVYGCAVCSRTFSSEKYLSMHVALHRKSTWSPSRFNVSVESTPKKQPITTARSLADAVNRTKWTCNVCSKSFAQNSNYKNHIRTHSDERPFVCHVCSIGFKERYHLKKHTLFKHTGELNEACRQCGKRFKDSTAVRAHERIHSELRPYSCVRCGKAFKTSECLWHHDHRSKTCGQTKHLFDKHVLYGNCSSSSLSTAANLTSSSSEMKFKQCTPLSASATVTQTQIKAQQQLDSDATPRGFIQQSCIPVSQSCVEQERVLTVKSDYFHPLKPPQQLIAKQQQNLADDQSTLTNNTMPLVSSASVTTNQPFQSCLSAWTQNNANKPIAVVVGQHFTVSPCATLTTTTVNNGGKLKAICSRCGKQFASPLAFERHLVVHNEARPYRCQICDVGFKLKVHLKKHNLYRHNTDYPCRCGVCGKPFKDSSAVRLHERIHSTTRPFQCACGKTFKTRENLWGHRHRRPCANRFGVDPVKPSCNTTPRNASTPMTSLFEANNGIQNKPVAVCHRDVMSTCSQVWSGMTSAGCEDVNKPNSVQGSTMNFVTMSKVDNRLAVCDEPTSVHDLLPSFDKLSPSLQHSRATAKLNNCYDIKDTVTSLNDVIVDTITPPTMVKLPCIEQLFDRTTWPSPTIGSTSGGVTSSSSSDDNAGSLCVSTSCWDVDMLWLDHKMAGQLHTL